MPMFRRKPTTVDAEQFTDITKPPRGVLWSEPSGMYVVITLQGMRVGVRLGEWIVKENGWPDRYYPVADSVFRETYESI